MASRSLGQALLRACAQGSLPGVKRYAPMMYAGTGKADHTIKPPLKLALATAAEHGQSHILRYLFTTMPQCQPPQKTPWDPEPELSEADGSDEWGQSLILPELVILRAVTSDSPDTFQTLMDFGVQVDECLDKSVTPLAVAIHNQRINMVRFLLSKGANASEQMWLPGFTLLGRAAVLPSLEILKLLLQHRTTIEGSHALREAAEAGRIDSASMLLEHGANIDEVFTLDLFDPEDSSGRLGTALHAAVQSDQVEFVRFLLSRGARTDMVDGQGLTPREIAVQGKQEAMLSILPQHTGSSQ